MKSHVASVVLLLSVIATSCSSTDATSATTPEKSGASVEPSIESDPVVVSTEEDMLSDRITEAVDESAAVAVSGQLDLFAEHDSWVAVDLDGQPVVAGPVLESAAAADFTPPNRIGQIAGCVLDAGSWAFVLDDNRLVTDEFASIDFDCDLETDSSQVDSIRTLVFGASQVEVAGSELHLTDGTSTLTFEPLR